MEVATPTAPERARLDADARAAAGGDLAAFERLYRCTLARVHTLARRLVGRARADDATQDIYLKAWARLSSWRGEASVATWLQRLAWNRLIDLAARPAETSDPATLDELAAPASAEGLRLDLEQAIQCLPAGARTIFVLHDIEGFSHEEIAARLRLSSGTSKSQLHRARLLLRAALSEGWTP